MLVSGRVYLQIAPAFSAVSNGFFVGKEADGLTREIQIQRREKRCPSIRFQRKMPFKMESIENIHFLR